MAFIPKTFKYKKYKKGRISQSINKRKKINFGSYALISTEAARLTYNQIEATRRFLKKKIKPFGGILKRKINLKIPITNKSAASRMGRGKGKVNFHIAPISSGTILYEIYCLNKKIVYEASLKAIHKLPIKVKIEKKL